METENNKVEDDNSWDFYYNPDPKVEAELEAYRAAYNPRFYALVDKVKAGEMIEDECVAAVLQLQKELGDPSDLTPYQREDNIRGRMKSILDPDWRKRIKRETGRIVD